MLFALLAGSLPRGTRTWLHFLARGVDQEGKVPTNQSVNQPLRAQKHRLRWKLLTTLCPMMLHSHKSFVPMEQQTTNNNQQPTTNNDDNNNKNNSNSNSNNNINNNNNNMTLLSHSGLREACLRCASMSESCSAVCVDSAHQSSFDTWQTSDKMSF